MIRGAAATGIINVAAAAVVAVFLLRHVVSARELAVSLGVLAAALGLLVTLLVRADGIETSTRQRLYADPIIAFERSAYQEIVVTRRGADTRLYLDGGLQFSTRDEYRYTESLVYPALGDGARSALILGGGDGLAARELLRQPGIETIVQVELDPAVVEIGRTTLRDANAGALDDPRVDVVIDDAMTWLRDPPADVVPRGGFDAVIVDLPDPDTPVLGRLYSTEFYALVTRALAVDGLMVGAGGQPVLDADRVLAHGLDDPGGGLRGDAVPRARADIRRLGLRAGPPRRRRSEADRAGRRAPAALPRPAGARRRHGVRRRHAARRSWSPRRWTTLASSRTCAWVTAERQAPAGTGYRSLTGRTCASACAWCRPRTLDQRPRRCRVRSPTAG